MMLQLSRDRIVADRAMPNLEPFQFWGVIRTMGEESNLRAWVDNVEDPTERAFLSATLDYTKWFEWGHPFIDAAQEALGISDEELRDLWLWAASVKA